MNPIGYLGIFVGAFLEGEVVYISAIQAARAGYVDFYGAIATFFLGTFFTDWFYFLTGRRQGRHYLERSEKLQRKAAQIDQLMYKHGTLLLLSYRFIYGFRIVLPLLFGVSKLSIKRFLGFSLLSTSIWMSVYGWIGYYFTTWLMEQLKSGRGVIGVLVVAGLIGLVFWVKGFTTSKKY
ncbi:MAG: DedA family protein [Haliscomenobacter sp.]|nr:DedA family protein [Haliscomenobacter sp.]MBK9487336.1 DedA family protein [Haliscomenobacter sp.]